MKRLLIPNRRHWNMFLINLRLKICVKKLLISIHSRYNMFLINIKQIKCSKYPWNAGLCTGYCLLLVQGSKIFLKKLLKESHHTNWNMFFINIRHEICVKELLIQIHGNWNMSLIPLQSIQESSVIARICSWSV